MIRVLMLSLILCCLSGCLIVKPVWPRTIPGYGQDYQTVGQDGRSDLSGLLLARSHYVSAPQIAVFEITEGKAVIPESKAVRFYYSTPPHLPVYFCTFENASSTYVFPLVPGYVCEEPYARRDEGVLSAPGWKGIPDEARIVLVPATPAEELEMLRDVANHMRVTPAEQKTSDVEARQRVLEYASRRAEQLGGSLERDASSRRTDYSGCADREPEQVPRYPMGR